MKKVVSAVLIAIVLFAFYNYQKPMLSTEQAIVQAYGYLKNPPSGTGVSVQAIQVELDAVPTENITLALRQQEGFLNELFNDQQWEVTISYEDVIPTVVMDAVTGEVLDIRGPLN
ncbi:hypothetical protein [Planococcus halotolerans]|uniref:PepSY domain-containing protein n=1 Tax=Planococcus halotolerans TaxID=2233542 RepID=A0A365L7E3_9BACL|nr:hypothetical protein [Planococcus halotolerans]RAZ81332.1 hypothetical protein DP120_03350 [Planococcus halotolerans]